VGVFAFFLAMPLWYLARGRRAMFAVPMAEAGKAASGGAISLLAYGAIIWAMQTSPMGAVSALRENQRCVRGPARSRVSRRAPDRLADRGGLHHRRGRGLRRLAPLTSALSEAMLASLNSGQLAKECACSRRRAGTRMKPHGFSAHLIATTSQMQRQHWPAFLVGHPGPVAFPRITRCRPTASGRPWLAAAHDLFR